MTRVMLMLAFLALAVQWAEEERKATEREVTSKLD
jgi:hypothetical protein